MHSPASVSPASHREYRTNVLPRLLYLFQMLPVNIPNCTFDNLDKFFSKLIRRGKRPRIKFQTLKLSNCRGGGRLFYETPDCTGSV